MSYRKAAERDAFSFVPETCPKVDRALEEAGDVIKEQTGNLREALVDALERALEAEAKVEELEKELEDLKSEA